MPFSSCLEHQDLAQCCGNSWCDICPVSFHQALCERGVKTRERRGSSFSQLGLGPNHTGLTAQSLFIFLEESCGVKRSDTQTFSNYSKKSSKLSKTFSSFSKKNVFSSNSQITYKTPTRSSLNIKVLRHGSNNIKKETKDPQKTKNPSPNSSTHKLVPFGSKLVPIWFLRFDGSDNCSYKLETVTYLFSCTCSVPR